MNARKDGTGANKRRLFHGTDAATVRAILSVGFNRSFSRNAAYGNGVYFADDRSKAGLFGKTILRCEVRTGRSLVLRHPATSMNLQRLTNEHKCRSVRGVPGGVLNRPEWVIYDAKDVLKIARA